MEFLEAMRAGAGAETPSAPKKKGVKNNNSPEAKREKAQRLMVRAAEIRREAERQEKNSELRNSRKMIEFLYVKAGLLREGDFDRRRELVSKFCQNPEKELLTLILQLKGWVLSSQKGE